MTEAVLLCGRASTRFQPPAYHYRVQAALRRFGLDRDAGFSPLAIAGGPFIVVPAQAGTQSFQSLVLDPRFRGATNREFLQLDYNRLRKGDKQGEPGGIPLVHTTLMSAFTSSRQANPWLLLKRLAWAGLGGAGGAADVTTVDQTLMRGLEPHDR